MNNQKPSTDAEFFAWNEEMAAKYDPETYHAHKNPIVRWVEASRVRRILKFLQPKCTHRVLEVGVGAGNILEYVPARHRCGLDLSPTLLAQARKRLPDAELIQGDAQHFPESLRQKQFDRVFCSEVLEHVPNPEAVVREMAAVLTQEGIAVISVPNEQVINRLKAVLLKLGVFRLLFPGMATNMMDEWHLHLFSRKRLEQAVQGVFTIDQFSAVPFQWLPIRLVARLRHVNASGRNALHPEQNRSDGLFITLKNKLKRFPRFYQALVALFGVSFAGISPGRFLRDNATAEAKILDLGSGPKGQRMHPGIIHVDRYAFPGVDVVADITHLPFADASVDAVMCIEVLEHVRDPHAVMSEIRRVLKPGGACYITTPFMYPYHSSPNDYQRWTLDGLRVLVGEGDTMTVVDAGLRHGPTSALATLFAQWLAVLLSFNSKRLYGIILVFTTIVCTPIAHLVDLLLNRYQLSETIASGHYLVARKRQRDDVL